jgi:hypothetical protein
MSCDKTYGVTFCGFDNMNYNHPDYPKVDLSKCCPKTDYFPETPSMDTNLYICNHDDTEKIFRRLECGQKVIPEYRPSFDICRQQVDLNEIIHPHIGMLDPCKEHENEFTPCKGDGLGFLKRVLIDSELKCMNQYLSKVHETSAFKPKKIPNVNIHDKYVSVAGSNLGPHQVCGPLSINHCVNYKDKALEKCPPYGLMHVGEHEKPIDHRITVKNDGPGMFLPIGPTRCDEGNRCEMIWDNISKRQYIDSRPNYIKPDNQYQPLAFEGHTVPCPPVCKYDYTCIE